jgi:hypothetical protein
MTRYTGVDVDKKNAEILKAKDNIKNIQDSKIAAKKLEEIREDEEIIRNKIKHEKQFNKIFESKITRVTESPEKFIFHGEDENSDERGTSGTLAWRKHLWNQALDGYHAAPLMGQGFAKRIVETLIWGSLAKMDGNWISGPHNSFLAIAFRMGIIGIFFLFCAIGIALYIGIINRKFNPISTLIFAGFIGIFAYANFNVCLENPQAGIWFWFFLSGLALSKLTLTETE